MQPLSSFGNRFVVCPDKYTMISFKGRAGGLSVILGAYKSNVQCIMGPPFHDYGECSKVLDRMQVTNFPHLFSHWEIPRKKSVIVPTGGIKFTGE